MLACCCKLFGGGRSQHGCCKANGSAHSHKNFSPTITKSASPVNTTQRGSPNDAKLGQDAIKCCAFDVSPTTCSVSLLWSMVLAAVRVGRYGSGHFLSTQRFLQALYAALVFVTFAAISSVGNGSNKSVSFTESTSSLSGHMPRCMRTWCKGQY